MSLLITNLILLHVTAGTVAVLAGAFAMTSRKGQGLHIKSGRIFAVSMIASSALGSCLGLIKYETLYITFHAGVLATTLILSSYDVLRGRKWHRMIAVINALNFAGLVTAAILAAGQPNANLFGFHAADYGFLAGLTGIALVCDLSIRIWPALSNQRRISEHLWRMCTGFFIAAGSAFTGPGMVIFPEWIQASGLLSLPELLIFVALIFWLIRIRFRRFQ